MNILSDFIIRINDMHPVNRVPVSEDHNSKAVVKRNPVSAASKSLKMPKVVKIKVTKQNINGFNDIILVNKTDLRSLTKITDVNTMYKALAGADAKTKKALTLHMAKLQFKEFNQMQSANIPVSETEKDNARSSILTAIKKIVK